MRRLIGMVVDFKDDSELRGMMWATAYGFFILFSYYIIRPVRDEISAADRGNLQILWTAVFLVMLLAVPAYSWIASRYPRGVFVPLANRFFIACLLGFWACLAFLPVEARAWIDRVFYIWVSMFALFVVTVFWGLVADCFDSGQGKRLFGFIAVGSSIGAWLGSGVTAVLATAVPTFALLLIACVPLEGGLLVRRGAPPQPSRRGHLTNRPRRAPPRGRAHRSQDGVPVSVSARDRRFHRIHDVRVDDPLLPSRPTSSPRRLPTAAYVQRSSPGSTLE